MSTVDMLLLMKCSSLLIFKCLTKNYHGIFVGITSLLKKIINKLKNSHLVEIIITFRIIVKEHVNVLENPRNETNVVNYCREADENGT